MPPKVTISVDIIDALAKSKLTNLGIQADKLRTKKIVMKADLQGNAIANTLKLADAQGRAVTMNERWTKSGKQVTTVTQEMTNATGKASKAFTMMNAVVLRLATVAISTLTKSLKTALTEMKNVDTQLTTISRITQTNISDLDGLKNKAYEVAKAYGVLASDYLSAAAAFTRAGYRDQAEDLAELSSKMQIAGQVSAETANQLLIATDKAYKLNGSYEVLSDTMDKMTVIDHNYATSVEKIAEGMGLVAPIAAQAHMSIDELIASLGTITAVSQRGGAEAARALRALILSIIKDTTTEIDEGVTWTVEEINSLQDALKLYAPEVVKAAEATGSLIDPMEAIAALAKSYEDGLLTEAKLAQITSSLGGKLRASQLLSLIQNYSGMYTQMMQDMGNAIGAVDKDVDKALQSWEAKLNQLKTTFAQSAESILNTDAIKGFIDSFRFLIETIDNPDEYGDKFAEAFEKAVHKLVERLPRIQKVISQVALTIAKTLIETIKDEALNALKSLADGSSKETNELAKALPDVFDNLFQIIGEVAMQSLLDSDLAFNLTVALLEGIVKAIPRAFEGFFHGIANAILEASENGLQGWAMDKIANQNGVIGKGLRYLFNQIAGSEVYDVNGGYSESFKKAQESESDLIDTDKDFVEATKDVESAIEDTTDAFSEQSEAVSEATSALANYKKALEGGEKGDNLKSYADAYKSAVEMFEKGLTGTKKYMSAVDLLFGSGIVETYEEAGELLGNEFIKAMFEGGGDDFGANAANYIRNHLDEFKGVAIKEADDGTFSLIVEDMEAFAESANISVGAIESLVDALDGFDSKELDGTINSVGSFIDEEKKIDISVQTNAFDVIDYIEESLKDLNNTVITFRVKTKAEDRVGSFLAYDNKMNTVETGGSFTHSYNSATGNSSTHGGSGGRFASGTRSARGGLSLVNEEGAEIIYAKGRAWIAGNGKPVITDLPQGSGVFNAKDTREILSRSGINSFALGLGSNTVMLSDGGSGSANNGESLTAGGIPNISNSTSGGKKPSQSLSSIIEELAKYIDKILKKAKEALKEQLDAIDEQIDKLKREHEAEENANKLEELRLKILEAEKRLAEAENERTVRYFNSETGQWEWMADQKAVAEAQKALEDAQKAYDDEVAEQEYEAQLQALQDQKDALNAAYDDLENRWNKILEALQESENGSGTTDVAKLLESLGKIAGGSTSSDISKILEELAKFTENPTSVLDAETTARIMSAQGSSLGGSAPMLSAMLGASAYDLNAKGSSVYSNNASNIVGDTIYYINGVQIGRDMIDKPLSQILSVLPIYAN